jgi:hypothetical protein
VTVDVQKFQGGGTWIKAGLGLGVVGLALTAVGAFTGAKREVLFAYLTSFSYWAGLSMAALILLMIFHAFNAKWMTVLRRPLEAMATTAPLFLLLFIPIGLGLGEIYSWVNPEAHNFTAHEVHLLHAKHSYLNVKFFWIRTVIYFAVATFIGWRLFGLSTRSDASGDPQLLRRQRRLGTGGLPFIAIVVSFASFDWLMSLNPIWFSTIFGVYYFAGSFVSVIALLILATNAARGPKDLFGTFMTVEHIHNLGKLLLAFTAFWAYIAFSQLLLIWIANLPEETPFYLVRGLKPGNGPAGGWAPVSIILGVCKFAIPFFALLSRDLKRTPKLLAIPAIWTLVFQFVDIYWLVWPTLTPDRISGHWTLVTSFVGIGGLAMAFTVWRLRGRFTLPVKDPFLPVSLRYKQP